MRRMITKAVTVTLPQVARPRETGKRREWQREVSKTKERVQEAIFSITLILTF